MARPAKHDMDDILEAAMALFWEKGYRGVSVSDIVKATGVLPGSLYGRFGNKEGVFVECIHHYAKKAACYFTRAEGAATPLAQIEAWFEGVIANSVEACDRQGCFVLNSLLELAQENDRVAEVAKGYINDSERWIEEKLEAAMAAGELSDTVNPKQMALCLFGVIYGVRGMSRAGESADRLRSYLDGALSALLDPHRVCHA